VVRVLGATANVTVATFDESPKGCGIDTTRAIPSGDGRTVVVYANPVMRGDSGNMNRMSFRVSILANV
jgi:hypothetical protein